MKLEPDAREAEQANPDDKALAYVTLDGTEGALCVRCDRVVCVCCEFCDVPRTPYCACDQDPISQYESRQMVARAGLGPSRFQR